MKKVSETSRQAHKENIASGLYTTQERILVDAIKKNPSGITRKELAAFARVELCAVTGRINDLVYAGAVKVVAKRKCSISGRNVGVLIA